MAAPARPLLVPCRASVRTCGGSRRAPKTGSPALGGHGRRRAPADRVGLRLRLGRTYHPHHQRPRNPDRRSPDACRRSDPCSDTGRFRASRRRRRVARFDPDGHHRLRRQPYRPHRGSGQSNHRRPADHPGCRGPTRVQPHHGPYPLRLGSPGRSGRMGRRQTAGRRHLHPGKPGRAAGVLGRIAGGGPLRFRHERPRRLLGQDTGP